MDKPTKKRVTNSSGAMLRGPKKHSFEDPSGGAERKCLTEKNKSNKNEEINDEDRQESDVAEEGIFTDDSESESQEQFSSNHESKTSSNSTKGTSFTQRQSPEPSSSRQQPTSFSPPIQTEASSPGQQQESSTSEKSKKQKQKSSPPETLSANNLIKTVIVFGIIAFLISILYGNGASNSSSTDNNWRSKIDPNKTLLNDQRDMIRASLKPILDKSFTKAEDEGVSTLLILSSDEESAAKVARCLLRIINKKTDINQISTEINLQSHSGGKLQLDTNLRTLFDTTDTVRAVLLRRIDAIPYKDTLEQLRLLFAYCDGENPVFPHRLIIMTSASDSENELRETYKSRLPKEHDFIDALMARISGHTVYIDKDQKPIC